MKYKRVSSYLSDCIDEGYFPSEDELEEEFWDIDRDELSYFAKRVAGIHDLSETNINWEGDLDVKVV